MPFPKPGQAREEESGSQQRCHWSQALESCDLGGESLPTLESHSSLNPDQTSAASVRNTLLVDYGQSSQSEPSDERRFRPQSQHRLPLPAQSSQGFLGLLHHLLDPPPNSNRFVFFFFHHLSYSLTSDG